MDLFAAEVINTITFNLENRIKDSSTTSSNQIRHFVVLHSGILN